MILEETVVVTVVAVVEVTSVVGAVLIVGAVVVLETVKHYVMSVPAVVDHRLRW